MEDDSKPFYRLRMLHGDVHFQGVSTAYNSVRARGDIIKTELLWGWKSQQDNCIQLCESPLQPSSVLSRCELGSVVSE